MGQHGQTDEQPEQRSLRREERQVEFTVRRAYYGVIREQQTLRVRVVRLERARTGLQNAIERENPLDISIAQLDVSEAEEDLLRAQRGVAGALDQLKIGMGMDVTAPLAIAASFEYQTVPLRLDEDLPFAFAHDEELVNAALNRRKIENRIRVERPRALPKVTLSATVEQPHEDGENPDDETDVRTEARVSWPLGAPAERATYRQALNDLSVQDVQIEDLREQKTRSLRDLARRITEAETAVTLQETRVKLSERRVQLYADRWENGEVDILEYTRSQADLENNRVRLIETKTSYLDLLGEYRFAVGR